MSEDDIDLEEGRRRRDDGINKVFREKWRRQYRELFNEFKIGSFGIAESFHTAMRMRGLEEPHAPQAWSGAWNSLVKAKCVELTGNTGQMRRPKAHARAHCPIFQKVKHASL